MGLSVMSILADSCAGTQKRLVTDKVKSYRAVHEAITALHGGTFGTANPLEHERLVTISLKVVDPSRFSLARLVDYRKREERDASLRDLRHNYLKKVDSFAARAAAGQHDGDKREIERQFELEVKDDLRHLKEALRMKAESTLLSKEVGVGVLAAAGVMTPVAVPAALLGVGALVKRAIAYRAERRQVFRDNAMSWLFQLQGGRVEPY